MIGGTSAGLVIDGELKEAVCWAAQAKVRAVKVLIDPKKERLWYEDTVPETASLADDFDKAAALLKNAEPCYMLIRLQGEGEEGSAPEADENSWAMICWQPSDTPVKLRMLLASSTTTLKKQFSDLTLKEYHATDREEVSLKAYIAATRELTESERYAAMSQQEIDADKVRKEAEKEQKAAPKLLAGLVALQIHVEDSFKDAVAKLVSESGKAVVAKLCGAKSEAISGEVIDGVNAPSDLKGKLPADTPAYVLLRVAETRVLVISWLPEYASVKLKMKCSTFKASVMDTVKDMTKLSETSNAEVTSEEDLVDSLADKEDKAAAEARPSKKLPPGAVAMPGMGMGKPPPGAVALPGMGGFPR